MSHYSVIVIGDNPEEQLAPFDENLEVEEYEDVCYCVHLNLRQAVDAILFKEFGDFNENFKKPYNENEDKNKVPWKEFIKPYIDRREELSKQLSDQFHKPVEGCERCGGTGKVKTTYNPKSKWDWYSLGGRWSGYFKLKPGKEGVQGVHRAKEFAAISGAKVDDLPQDYVDQARKGDIDFERMIKDSVEAAEKTWAEYEKAKAESDKYIDSEWSFGIKDGETKESFIKRNASVSTYAVIKDGEWYGQGEMGWFGISTGDASNEEWNKKFEELLDSVSDDTLISIYDLHI